MPSATLIIPTHNRAALLRQTLASVRALAVPPGWQIDAIVADNACGDETAQVIADAAAGSPIAMRRVAEPRLGASHARNRALLATDADWAVFFDDDVLIAGDWLIAFADAVARHRPDCIVGPVGPWLEAPLPRWATPTIVRFVTSAYSRRGDALHFIDPACAHEFPGGNAAVRRAAAIAAGGFSPILGRRGRGLLAGEDSELGLRLARQGCTFLYVPRCRIRHFIGKEKLDPRALKARWRGAGAARRVIEALDGNRAAPGLLWRRFAGMTKAAARSRLLRVLGRGRAALHHDLHARYWWGYLTASPPRVPRRWPPVPLGQE